MAQTVSEVIHKTMGVLAFMHMFLVLVLASRGVTAVSMESVSAPAASSKCKITALHTRKCPESTNVTGNLSFLHLHLARSLHSYESVHRSTDSIHK